MNIAITGNLNKDTGKKYTVHKTLRPGYKLYIGSECNDGRPITESWRYKQAIKLGIPIIREKPQVAPQQHYEAKEMFVDKYSPKSISDIIGHKEQINQITNWLQSWDQGTPERSESGAVVTAYPETRGVLVTGPPGIGKTTAVHLIIESLGYKVKEYNASDTRSVSMLRGLFALGIKRLIKEVIVMDEVDGLSERGGVGEIASIIKKTTTPIICIANEKPPKLRPIINACLDIKFNRPVKSTIATALLKVAREEKIDINKVDLETLCENSGNDIRSILNNLEFYGSDTIDSSNKKDSNLRLDLFSATQRLIGNKKASLDEAANLVFVDYNMVPLMVQEAYINSSRGSLEDACKAAEFISSSDIIDKRIHRTHDWSLLPHYVQSIVSAAKTVSGPAPFQIFPSWLGKNSKRLKHRRYIDDLSSKVFCSNESFRLDYAEPLQTILLNPLKDDKPDIKTTIKTMDQMRFTRDDIMDNLQEIMFDKFELSTKTKTAFTREYNKVHLNKKTTKTMKKLSANDMDLEDDEEEEDNKVEELEEDIQMLEL
jgi:replication factor C subunit 1